MASSNHSPVAITPPSFKACHRAKPGESTCPECGKVRKVILRGPCSACRERAEKDFDHGLGLLFQFGLGVVNGLTTRGGCAWVPEAGEVEDLPSAEAHRRLRLLTGFLPAPLGARPEPLQFRGLAELAVLRGGSVVLGDLGEFPVACGPAQFQGHGEPIGGGVNGVLPGAAEES